MISNLLKSFEIYWNHLKSTEIQLKSTEIQLKSTEIELKSTEVELKSNWKSIWITDNGNTVWKLRINSLISFINYFIVYWNVFEINEIELKSNWNLFEILTMVTLYESYK